jgi:hypothetical protein
MDDSAGYMQTLYALSERTEEPNGDGLGKAKAIR